MTAHHYLPVCGGAELLGWVSLTFQLTITALLCQQAPNYFMMCMYQINENREMNATIKHFHFCIGKEKVAKGPMPELPVLMFPLIA